MTAKQELLSFDKTKPMAQANPLAAVIVWELRRLRANRLSWAFLGAAFLFFLALILFKHNWFWATKDNGGTQIQIFASTAVGAFMEVAYVQLLFFGMFLPFFATDSIAREYKQRTHELLMTTPIPNWAFVLGRFLVTLLIGLALAVLVLLATVALNVWLAQAQANYPPLNWSAYVQVWALMVLPATFLLCAVSFALGTLLPRLATPIKVGLLIFWVMLFVLGNALQDHLGDWVEYVNPTSSGMATVLLTRYLQNVQVQIQSVTVATQQAQIALQLQQQPLDLGAWVLPYLGLVVFGAVLVGSAAIGFQRFRNAMG